MGKLCLLFLNHPIDAPRTKQHTLRRLGAMHKARWMAKVIYSIKMCTLENQLKLLPKGTIATEHHLAELKEFVIFITVYSKWWFLCPSVTDASWHDLYLIKDII